MKEFAVTVATDEGADAKMKKAWMPYEPQRKKELKVAAGDLIMVSPTKKHEPYKSNAQWLHGNIGIKSGYFPAGVFAEPKPKKRALTDFERFGVAAFPEEASGQTSAPTNPTKPDFSKLRRTSSLSVVYAPKKMVRHGPKVNTMVFLMRENDVGPYGFTMESDSILNAVSPAARLAVDHADPYGRDNKAGVSPKIEDAHIHNVSGTREGTPAFGKLFVGDVIESLNGVDARDTSHEELLSMMKEWDTMQVVVERAATTAMKAQWNRAAGNFGVSVILRPAGQPMIIKDVAGGSQAEGKMLAGDILEKVNGKNVAALSNAEVMQMIGDPSTATFNIDFARRDENASSQPVAKGSFL